MKATFALALVSLVSVTTAQRIVLPDNHNFMESATYGSCTGDTTYFRTTAGRFLIIYEASHFTNPRTGITSGSPITINNVRFRQEDGEANLGGQTYAGVIVQLGQTSLTSATAITTFGSATGGGPGTVGSLRDPAVTTLGPSGVVPLVTIAPSVGSCPNNYTIDIDLAAIAASYVYDPYSATQPNLVIDITLPAAPTNAAPLSLLGVQDTIAHGAGIRGKSWTTATVASATGTADTTPPVVGLGFTGGGGYASEVPAKAEYIGAGCGGSPSTFYQEFYQDQAFDIAGGFTLTPVGYSPIGPAPSAYTVTPGAGAFDVAQLNAVADSTLDDALLTVAMPPSWPLLYTPAGSTATIKPCTNGYIWLDAAMTAAEFTVSRTLMLGSVAVAGSNGPRLMPMWLDFTATKNTGIVGGLAGLHVKFIPETSAGAMDGELYVTWRNMGTFRTPGSATIFGHSIWNVQCKISQLTGVVEYRYGPCQPFFSALGGVYTNQTAAAIVGFTRGDIDPTAAVVASVDPGSRDLSDPGLLPYTTSVEIIGSVGNPVLTAATAPVLGSALQTGRMFEGVVGQTLTYTVSNVPVPVGLSLAILSFDVGPPVLSLPLFGVAPPGCTTAFPAVFPAVFNFASAFNVVGGTLPLVPALGPVPAHNALGSWAPLGLNVTAQVWVADLGTAFIVPAVSNTIKYVVGLD